MIIFLWIYCVSGFITAWLSAWVLWNEGDIGGSESSVLIVIPWIPVVNTVIGVTFMVSRMYYFIKKG